VSSIEDSASLKNSVKQQQEIVESTTRVHDVLTQVFQAADAQQQKQAATNEVTEPKDLVVMPEPVSIAPRQPELPTETAEPKSSLQSIRIFESTEAPVEVQPEPDEEEPSAPTPVKRFALPDASQSAQVFVRKKPDDKNNAA